MLWYANIKKASQDEQQNQTTTTNISYIKNFLSVLKNKNLITKSTYRQMNLKLNKIPINHQKRYGPNHKKGLVTIRQKRTKTVKLKNSLFLKTINFKVNETIRNQVKYPKVYDYQCIYRRALWPVLIHFFNWLKRTTKNNKKNSTESCQKTLSKPSSHISALKIYSFAPSSNTDNVVFGHY